MDKTREEKQKIQDVLSSKTVEMAGENSDFIKNLIQDIIVNTAAVDQCDFINFHFSLLMNRLHADKSFDIYSTVHDLIGRDPKREDFTDEMFSEATDGFLSSSLHIFQAYLDFMKSDQARKESKEQLKKAVFHGVDNIDEDLKNGK